MKKEKVKKMYDFSKEKKEKKNEKKQDEENPLPILSPLLKYVHELFQEKEGEKEERR